MRIFLRIFPRNILFLLTVFLLYCSQDNRSHSQSCISDNNCKYEEICSSGTCIIPECEKTSDCENNKICNSGLCLNPFCNKDNDCLNPLICHEGKCSGKKFSCNKDICYSNEICGYDKRCYNLAENIPCRDTLDCHSGICSDNICIKKSCFDSNDCPVFSFCNSGECQPIECAYSCNKNYICSDFKCYYRKDCIHYSECPETNICYKGDCYTLCSQSNDCPYSSICKDGLCKIISCVSNNDCIEGKCINKICLYR